MRLNNDIKGFESLCYGFFELVLRFEPIFTKNSPEHEFPKKIFETLFYL